MPINLMTVAFGAVIVAGLTLAAIGHPGAPAPIPLKTADAPNASLAAKEAASRPPGAFAGGVLLANISVELPTTGRPYAGAGSDVMNANCTACHSAGMVLTQPLLSRATWSEEVNKMRDAYKAPVADADMAAIVDYLAAMHPGG
jgi:cytochrome c5